MQQQTDKGTHRQAKRSEKGADCRVYVGNLDPAWYEIDLQTALSVFGKVVHASVCRNSYGHSKAYGFVTFALPEEANSSYGLLQFRNRVLEVKACIKRSERTQGTLKPATNFKTLIQKENIGVQTLSQLQRVKADSELSVKTRTVKLNKYSKDFDKIPQVTDDQTTIESDSDKITMRVIKVSDKTPIKSEFVFSPPSSRSDPDYIFKPLSEKTGISRLSKEFYPSRPPTFSPPTAIAGLPAPGGSFSPMMNPFLVFQPGYRRSEIEVNVREGTGSVNPRPHPQKEFKISFFTFPGRD